MKPESESGESMFHAVLGRALTDPKFREQLTDREHQAEALESMGVAPEYEGLEALNASIEALDRLSQAFGPIRAAT
jgi:hypothetical protein